MCENKIKWDWKICHYVNNCELCCGFKTTSASVCVCVCLVRGILFINFLKHNKILDLICITHTYPHIILMFMWQQFMLASLHWLALPFAFVQLSAFVPCIFLKCILCKYVINLANTRQISFSFLLFSFMST